MTHLSPERLADIRDCLRKYGKRYTFAEIVSDEEAFALIDMAALGMLDAITGRK